MELIFFDYCGFQPKLTHAKNIGGSVSTVQLQSIIIEFTKVLRGFQLDIDILLK